MRLNCWQASSEQATLSRCLRPTCQNTILLPKSALMWCHQLNSKLRIFFITQHGRRRQGVHLRGGDEDHGRCGEQPLRHPRGARGQGRQGHLQQIKIQRQCQQPHRFCDQGALQIEQALQVLRHWAHHAEQWGRAQHLRARLQRPQQRRRGHPPEGSRRQCRGLDHLRHADLMSILPFIHIQ